MIGLGILEKTIYLEVPPRVEYRLTEFGLRFMSVVDSIKTLQQQLEERSKE